MSDPTAHGPRCGSSHPGRSASSSARLMQPIASTPVNWTKASRKLKYVKGCGTRVSANSQTAASRAMLASSRTLILIAA
jgi:hypothetical protein